MCPLADWPLQASCCVPVLRPSLRGYFSYPQDASPALVLCGHPNLMLPASLITTSKKCFHLLLVLWNHTSGVDRGRASPANFNRKPRVFPRFHPKMLNEPARYLQLPDAYTTTHGCLNVSDLLSSPDSPLITTSLCSASHIYSPLC